MEPSEIINFTLSILVAFLIIIGIDAYYSGAWDRSETTSEPIHYFNQPAMCFDGYSHRRCGFLEHEQDI